MEGYLCENCYGSFMDPVCEKCQLKEFEAWLIDNNYPKINRQIILKAIRKRLLAEDNNTRLMESFPCIVCHEAHVFSCPDCLNQVALDVLEKFHANAKVMQDFLKSCGYAQRGKRVLIMGKRR